MASLVQTTEIYKGSLLSKDRPFLNPLCGIRFCLELSSRVDETYFRNVATEKLITLLKFCSSHVNDSMGLPAPDTWKLFAAFRAF